MSSKVQINQQVQSTQVYRVPTRNEKCAMLASIIPITFAGTAMGASPVFGGVLMLGGDGFGAALKGWVAASSLISALGIGTLGWAMYKGNVRFADHEASKLSASNRPLKA